MAIPTKADGQVVSEQLTIILKVQVNTEEIIPGGVRALFGRLGRKRLIDAVKQDIQAAFEDLDCIALVALTVVEEPR